MTRAELREKIAAAIYAVFNDRPKGELDGLLQHDTFRMDALTDSSIRLTELCFQIEEALEIEIETSEMFDNPSLATVLDRLHAKLPA
ncbi:phosphopantetheine-binding protein [Abyssibius alkaniclasticus]|uniref:phosphopantetheine-binding protein n=1 Tax=Abyssibius alkaniclasticus TaxID=2881234 RepID=UPI002363DDE7|nr:phosphopantetheine-binding protein [Abyssibius alkaniclasticus]UPH71576.1 phosphopantetheine-binding protein [Abyssibius alkaniclasticus]